MYGENMFFSLKEHFDFFFPSDRVAERYPHRCHVDATHSAISVNSVIKTMVFPVFETFLISYSVFLLELAWLGGHNWKKARSKMNLYFVCEMKGREILDPNTYIYIYI